MVRGGLKAACSVVMRDEDVLPKSRERVGGLRGGNV